jgi:hypothetical protein
MADVRGKRDVFAVVCATSVALAGKPAEENVEPLAGASIMPARAPAASVVTTAIGWPLDLCNGIRRRKCEPVDNCRGACEHRKRNAGFIASPFMVFSCLDGAKINARRNRPMMVEDCPVTAMKRRPDRAGRWQPFAREETRDTLYA